MHFVAVVSEETVRCETLRKPYDSLRSTHTFHVLVALHVKMLPHVCFYDTDDIQVEYRFLLLCGQ
jgi:hypothetical protein